MKKLNLILILFFLCFQLYSQQDYEFGDVTPEELEMSIYEKDSTANAVILYEHSETEFIKEKKEFFIETTVYRKIKILNQDGFESGNISITLYNNNKKIKETIHDLNAITHTKGGQFELKRNAIYKKRINIYINKITFAFPNVTVGSVLEYTYKIKSPYINDFVDWTFQSDIPKVISIFKAKLPILSHYNRKITGDLKLAVNDAYITSECINYVFGYKLSECEAIVYAMEDIPVFIEEEFITAKKNYISKITFEKSKYKNFFDGSMSNRPYQWKDIDLGFKKSWAFKNQFERQLFFQRKLTEDILLDSDDLSKAKKIYYFIQNHYTLNKSSSFKLENNDIKKAFRKEIGSLYEINLSLINSLNAVGLDSEIVLVSTRQHGLVTKDRAAFKDFNYSIVKTTIDGKTYFLDPSDKSLPFGIVPFACLNGEARVLNIKKGSYWEEIKPIEDTKLKINMLLQLNNEGVINGKMRVNRYGYEALNSRKEFNLLKEDKYLLSIEEENENLFIENYINKNLEEKEKPFTEELEITIENDDTIGGNIILNPFFFSPLKENPFKLKTRLYPVDFGYPKKFEFVITIIVPENYKVESMPTNKNIALPNNKGVLNYSSKYKNNKISINFKYAINSTVFESDEYQELKEFFNQIILSQNEPIILNLISN